MKKYLAILVAIILIVSMCAICACNNEITLYVPDGAPALSVAKLIADKSVGNTNINTVITTGEEVVAKCANGEADMAVLPTNAAVNICTKRSDYLLFSVNVYGVLYVVGTEPVESLSDLQGETLYSIGLGNTPEYVFKKICDVYNVNYQDDSQTDSNAITIKYQTDATTIISQILQGKAKFALLGEPAVTQLTAKAAGQNITVYNLFDLQEMWQQATGSDVKGYPQASLIVKKDLLTDAFAQQLMSALTANSDYITTNCDKLSDLLGKAGSSLTISYNVNLLNRCNLTVISARDAKSDISKYLSTFGINTIADSIYYETKD